MAAGISLTQGYPQPNCLPWAMPLTQGSRKRKELAQAALETRRNGGMSVVGRSGWLSNVSGWEQIRCPRGVSSRQCEVMGGRAVRSGVFYPSEQK